MKVEQPYLKTVLAGLLSIISANASAALVSLDGDGFTVTYDDQNTGLFGTPTLSGDGKTVLFSPLNFKAASTGEGFIQARSTTFFDLIMDDGKQLAGVSLIENGDYRLVNGGNLADVPTVDVAGQLRLTNLFTGNQFQTAEFSGGLLNATCATISSCSLTSWTVNAYLSAPEAWGDIDVRVGLENILTAQSNEIRDLAEIEKKHASQTISMTPKFVVPAPGAVWLFGSALAGLMGFRRKK